MNIASMNQLLRSRVHLRIFDRSGHLVQEETVTNKITNDGASVLSRLMVEYGAPRPSHLWARFASSLEDAKESTKFITPEDQLNIRVADFISGSSATRGAVREGLHGVPLRQDNGDVAGGTVTWSFRLSADTPIVGTYAAGTSQLYFLGLAAAHSSTDHLQDKITNLVEVTGLDIPAGGQLGVDYEINFSA